MSYTQISLGACLHLQGVSFRHGEKVISRINLPSSRANQFAWLVKADDAPGRASMFRIALWDGEKSPSCDFLHGLMATRQVSWCEIFNVLVFP